MAEALTRRALLAAATAAGSSMLLGCSGSSATNASTTTGSPGEFDFTKSTPLGRLIPAEGRQSAPAFSGEYLDGTAFHSASLDGDLAVINFWGSWCAPCRIETPEFQAVYTDVADSGVQFLGVDVKDQRQLGQAFVDSVGATHPSLFDPRGEVALAFRGFPANVMPSTILLDRTGRVAAVHRVQTGLKDLRVALVALAGPDTAGVTVTEDVDKVYAAWLDELGADVVLVRPDFHVYGAGSSDQAAELAAGFLTRLGAFRPLAVT